LTAAERARRPRGIRNLAGIEGIAAAPARRGGRPCRFLNDRGRSGDLRLVTGLRLPRCRLHRRSGGDAGLDHGRLTCGGLTGRNTRCATLKRPQALLKLPVAVLQLFVLAGELPQLIFELLDAHFRVDLTGLRERR
jgi:hypothetical protein